MKRRGICGFLVPLLLIAPSATGQSALIHQQMQQTYNFQPHLLNKRQIDQASVVLDHFWTKAKTERSQYVPALRQELSDFKNSPFFLYDGSMLLLSLSDTPIDRKIALAAMARYDLRDVQANDYFLQVHRMATLNEDTTAAAFPRSGTTQIHGVYPAAGPNTRTELRPDLPVVTHGSGLLAATRDESPQD